MAIIYAAELAPTKPELVEAWLDRQPWGGDGPVEVLGSYRFDDPDGEVGVEVLLAQRGDRTLQVPFTYRGAPLEGGSLVSTMDHSVLGDRWVYEAGTDPVAVACLTRALAGEQEPAVLERHDPDGSVTALEQTVTVRRAVGSKDVPGRIQLIGELDPTASYDCAEQLVATWSGGEAVVALR